MFARVSPRIERRLQFNILNRHINKQSEKKKLPPSSSTCNEPGYNVLSLIFTHFASYVRKQSNGSLGSSITRTKRVNRLFQSSSFVRSSFCPSVPFRSVTFTPSLVCSHRTLENNPRFSLEREKSRCLRSPELTSQSFVSYNRIQLLASCSSPSARSVQLLSLPRSLAVTLS